VGTEFAKQCRASTTSPIYALTRDIARSTPLARLGVLPIVGHWHAPATLQGLPNVRSIIVAVPHREDSGLGAQSHSSGLSNLIDNMPSGWQKLIYLSTTGVYGDAHDEVDETTPVQPTRIGTEIAVAAEQWLLDRFPSSQLTIVRLSGIYGPGRIPLAEKIRTGEPLQVPQEGWLNLVHVSDIAAMLLGCLETHLRRSFYVFSDGSPVERLEFYRTLANLCGVAEPTFTSPDPESSRNRRAGSKRVNPQRLMEELQLRLRFPTYREGLADCLKS
jgi:nucleoside-diphosphate-sugar epimerase